MTPLLTRLRGSANRVRSFGRSTFLIAWTCIVTESAANAQVGIIAPKVSCTSCLVEFDSITTLLDLTYDHPPSLIARSPSGSYFLWDNAAIMEYGANGRLTRQIGRRGGGPGEYELPRNIFVSADGALHVLDAQLARYTIFNPDGKIRSTRPLSAFRGIGWPAILTEKGDLIINAVFMNAADAGYALQRISRTGQLTRFDEGLFFLRKPWLQRRLLVLRSNGELLVGHPYTFAIDVYGPDLVKRRTVVWRERWVPREAPVDEPSMGVFNKAYDPRLDAMWEDGNGLLWVVRSIPSPAWKPHPAPVRGQIPSNYDDLTKRPRREMIVEVIDLSRNELVAQTRFPREIGLPFGAGYNAANINDGQGGPAVRITRFRLKR